MIIVPDVEGVFTPDTMLRATVRKVFDGDGFLADVHDPKGTGESKAVAFRFAFIDAPEIEQQCGIEAGRFLNELIANRTLNLAIIWKGNETPTFIDAYRRVLCMGFLESEMASGEVSYYHQGVCGSGIVKTARLINRNIELEMVINGWAWVVQQYSFDREDEYFAAQRDAQLNRRGLWGFNNPEPPWKFKARQRARTRAARQQGRLF